MVSMLELSPYLMVVLYLLNSPQKSSRKTLICSGSAVMYTPVPLWLA